MTERSNREASGSDEIPVALVTGGGTGIGSACCRALAAEGFRVAVHYRSSEEGALKLVAELPDAFAVRAEPRTLLASNDGTVEFDDVGPVGSADSHVIADFRLQSAEWRWA